MRRMQALSICGFLYMDWMGLSWAPLNTKRVFCSPLTNLHTIHSSHLSRKGCSRRPLPRHHADEDPGHVRWWKTTANGQSLQRIAIPPSTTSLRTEESSASRVGTRKKGPLREKFEIG